MIIWSIWESSWLKRSEEMQNNMSSNLVASSSKKKSDMETPHKYLKENGEAEK